MMKDIFKGVCSRFPKGVTVITGRRPSDGLPVGMTVSAFTGVSLEPPTVLICLRRDSATTAMLLAGDHFAVNVLSAHQQEISQRFATRGPENRFDGIDWQEGPNGVPLLPGTIGHFVCRRRSTVADGDHYVVFGEVVGGLYEPEEYPLVYWAGAYRGLAA